MRYYFISFLVHILLIQFIWVGFSVSKPKDQDSFTYWSGASVGTSEESSSLQTQPKIENILLPSKTSAASFEPWLRMRDLNKPH